MLPVVLATAGYDHTVRLWDVVNGCTVACMQHPEGHINCLAISPCRQWLATGGHLSIRLYDLGQLEGHTPGVAWGAAFTLEPGSGHEGNVMALGWDLESGERRLWSVGEDGTIRLWELREGKLMPLSVIRTAAGFTAATPLAANQLLTADEQGGVGVWTVGSGGGQCTLELVQPALSSSV